MLFVDLVYLVANVVTFLLRFLIFHYVLFADRTTAARAAATGPDSVPPGTRNAPSPGRRDRRRRLRRRHRRGGGRAARHREAAADPAAKPAKPSREFKSSFERPWFHHNGKAWNGRRSGLVAYGAADCFRSHAGDAVAATCRGCGGGSRATRCRGRPG